MFVESRIRQNLSVGRDFLYFDDVTTAINMNALEQRMIAKQKILKLIENDLPKDRLIAMIEEDIDIDRQRLTTYYHLPA